MINTSQKSPKSDRYSFKDYQEVKQKQPSSISPTHSLCINCFDYYETPPCQTNFTTDSSCFPSLISPERN
ncbi:MAG: hypothetical protein Tsb0014_30010 [Pleurocapsa sp.]